MSVVDVYERGAGVRLYTKADLMRALVAQQWAVACALRLVLQQIPEDCCDESAPLEMWSTACGNVAGLPCSADMVEELTR